MHDYIKKIKSFATIVAKLAEHVGNTQVEYFNYQRKQTGSKANSRKGNTETL